MIDFSSAEYLGEARPGYYESAWYLGLSSEIEISGAEPFEKSREWYEVVLANQFDVLQISKNVIQILRSLGGLRNAILVAKFVHACNTPEEEQEVRDNPELKEAVKDIMQAFGKAYFDDSKMRRIYRLSMLDMLVAMSTNEESPTMWESILQNLDELKSS